MLSLRWRVKNDYITATPTKKNTEMIILETEGIVRPYQRNIAPNVVSTTIKENPSKETLNLIA